MPTDTFQAISSTLNSNGDHAALELAIQKFQEEKDWHNLFDTLMLKRKYELGLELRRPSTLQDIPDDFRKEIEAVYIDAARIAGNGFLQAGDIASAWMYFKVIREPEEVRAAIDALPDSIPEYSEMEKITRIAIFEGVNPVKGVKIMLNANGPCNTITTLDQILSQMSLEDRARSIAVVVQRIYDDVSESVRRHLEQRLPSLEPDLSLEQLIKGRDWIFENGGYHTDPSHLNSVVRFARSLRNEDPELDLARQLALYGQKIEASLQYPGEPPFEDFYPAHLAFFGVLQGKDVEKSLSYFSRLLDQETDPREQSMLAYVLVDLLVRVERYNDAVEIAHRHLTGLGEDVLLSFDELCEKSGRWDLLKQLYQEQNNLVGYTSAALREAKALKQNSARS